MIEILLFAELSEKAETDRLLLAGEGKTVGELKEMVAKEIPALGSLEQIMVAINEEYANDHMTVKAGDVVALIPPVSGG
ncbi:molybdopterin converting factor subunit 1 [Halalkalibacterium halodurans]|jgi:molybdopterin synthase sulfur carrier subunit|uniref:Molybdopterin synthase sulfur carrier subunit n=2 Tax=Halalkalibacterium halodurans TaxID=86665 RepID=Q9K8I8_HALH5|nr:molybdopterin converting factor subunit 1 [Halalkalibacterium halodurans]MDY7223563.1 molybdopterin converting factor subunit 1 [Halalkalibacterium halodurans]MDY7242784.1 molybdopterin converting factor subunit 1 [Halalkalibacterium halodurans]MED3646583.1 molybdopterin converting factor subunit 1 [Halalkalibacterium halodurans]MED4082230.1 molybdopterin converting factor subunit 1 [Halalkalibacterium halodurans]MED4084537.1 molybdopterin converting factor subunit 1 [Halalkalibacterium hal